jgi:NAD(P)-dependent dehydrogenase (short-subunit alcohol dehydrogenase family)
MPGISKIFSLKDKVAIVTGAAGLIGKHHCEALAAADATVIACDINTSSIKDYVNKLGFNSMTIDMDVTDKSSIEIAKELILENFGRIDILVNNAAINDMFENPQAATEQSKFENYPLNLWKKSLDVNVTGVFLCSQIFGTEMAKNGKGSIINVASTYGIVGPDQSLYIDKNGKQNFYKPPAYSATKGAVISFTKFLAAYWGHKGVRVNTLSPGGVENSQDEFFVEKYSKKTPLGRMAAPTDYMGAVVFLASDASSYMTGANLVVDGGWTCW